MAVSQNRSPVIAYPRTNRTSTPTSRTVLRQSGVPFSSAVKGWRLWLLSSSPLSNKTSATLLVPPIPLDHTRGSNTQTTRPQSNNHHDLAFAGFLLLTMVFGTNHFYSPSSLVILIASVAYVRPRGLYRSLIAALSPALASLAPTSLAHCIFLGHLACTY